MSVRSADAKTARTKKKKPLRDVMTRNRTVRTPSVPNSSGEDDCVTLAVGAVGVKFACTLQRDWQCEAIIAQAIAQYHLKYPTCEIPDFNTIYHCARKEYVHGAALVGHVCQDGDDIDLGISDKDHDLCVKRSDQQQWP